MAVSLALPAAAAAQSPVFLEPAVAAQAIHDDNLFATPADPEAGAPEDDLILRLTPSLEAGYRSARLDMRTRHSIDAESYERRSDLNTAHAGRHSTLDLEYEATARLAFGIEGESAATNSPRDFVPGGGLDSGRIRARREAAAASAAYRFTPLFTGTLGYRLTGEEIEDGPRTETRIAEFGFEHEGRRDTWSLGYEFRHYDFAATTRVESHAARLGWTGRLSRRLDLTLHGGPVFTGGSVATEGGAGIAYTLDMGEASMSYRRTRVPVIGLVGIAEIEIVEAAITRDLTPALEVTVAPALVKFQSRPAAARTRRLTFEVTYALNTATALFYHYRRYSQEGSLEAPSDIRIDRNLHTAGIRIGFPSRSRGSERDR